MRNQTIKMTLLSDLCPASGDGFAGYVDTDVCFDDFGLPYIPAKRLKGCLRECGLDIISVDNSYEPVFHTLFGITGSIAPGTLHIGNGQLENYAALIGNIGDAYDSELAEVYTSVRSRTKMEHGKAVAGTLRTARVLNKGQVYVFPVALSDDDKEANNFLGMCVRSLRGMGLNRSRGLGEVRCELIDAGEKASGVAFTIEPIGGGCGFSYALELLEPVISAERSGKPTGTEDYIFGSTVLGAFAVKYIERYGLQRDTAYKDETFRRIFLTGGVTFTAALPFVNGTAYYPAPFVLKTNKAQNRLFDETLKVYDDDDADDADDKEPICRSLGGFVAMNNEGEVARIRPAKVAFLHHARPKDRSVAHATESDGEFYTYEALAAGQTFAGSVLGNEDDIQRLAALLSNSDSLRIGRSRTAQYGKVRISRLENTFTANALTLKTGDTFRLAAVTPLILEDKNGINKTDVSLIQDLLGTGFEIMRYACAETVVSGYYGKWLLPRRQERAIAEGSIIAFRYIGEGVTLNQSFIGKRTGEGFGQIRVERIPDPQAFTLAENAAGDSDRVETAMPQVKTLRTDKTAVEKGIDYGKAQFDTAPKNAGLSRILTALRQADGFAMFAKLLCGIKQPKQKVAALCFATGKEQRYFNTDASHLDEVHIAELLTKRRYDYITYQKYLTAAAQRIMQTKRKADANRKDGEGE